MAVRQRQGCRGTVLPRPIGDLMQSDSVTQTLDTSKQTCLEDSWCLRYVQLCQWIRDAPVILVVRRQQVQWWIVERIAVEKRKHRNSEQREEQT
jgi:hypothetical protein